MSNAEQQWDHERAKALVDASPLKKEAIAKEVGISERTLTNILQGQNPSLAVIKGLARVLGCKEEELLRAAS